jgi:hypothetical protein
MSEERPPRAEQQGDGQPENARELEDASGGAALAGDASAAERAPSAGEEPQSPRGASDERTRARGGRR